MDVPAPLASVLLGPSSATLNFEFKFLCLSPASPLSLSLLSSRHWPIFDSLLFAGASTAEGGSLLGGFINLDTRGA